MGACVSWGRLEAPKAEEPTLHGGLCTSKKTAPECEGRAMGQAQRSRRNFLEGESLPQLNLQRRAGLPVKSHLPPPTPQARQSGQDREGPSVWVLGCTPQAKSQDTDLRAQTRPVGLGPPGGLGVRVSPHQVGKRALCLPLGGAGGLSPASPTSSQGPRAMSSLRVTLVGGPGSPAACSPPAQACLYNMVVQMSCVGTGVGGPIDTHPGRAFLSEDDPALDGLSGTG